MSDAPGPERGLLAYSGSPGCAGNLSAASVAQLVASLPAHDDPNVLLGAKRLDDAGVYQLDAGLALVQAIDFFAPIVDDPYTFGRIAAANALGDIYATGGTPRTALNVVCFPEGKLELSVLSEILRGGCEMVEAAGARVLGGHSVRDQEVKFGLSVTGVVDPERMMTNGGARPGQRLILTKPLGTGVITTALRAGRCPRQTLEGAVASMVRLNADASRLAVAAGVRSATDLTGYGLLGHARDMARASRATLLIDANALPVLPGAPKLATPENRSSTSASNRQAVERDMQIDATVTPSRRELLFDPQTSGGLLLAVDAERIEELLGELHEAGDASAVVVGEVLEQRDVSILVEG